ncbi:hypothetical protein ZWY2020_032947 [Hordeum vulgare]|nr:hypothetical protein ZWY2020_032947 [Hordeum vulgare]
MHFDGSKMRTRMGAGIILTAPKGDQLKYALQIHFAASNNVAEYEALAHGLWLAKEIGIRRLICFGDSDLVVPQPRKRKRDDSGQEMERPWNAALLRPFYC